MWIPSVKFVVPVLSFPVQGSQCLTPTGLLSSSSSRYRVATFLTVTLITQTISLLKDFRPEDGSSMFLPQVDVHLQDEMTS
jgi:hypothetical protein